MEPFTILGAASSAVKIAVFGSEFLLKIDQRPNPCVQTTAVDLLSGELEDLKMEEPRYRIINRAISHDAGPEKGPDDIVNLIKTKLLAVLPTILVNSTQAVVDPVRPQDYELKVDLKVTE